MTRILLDLSLQKDLSLAITNYYSDDMQSRFAFTPFEPQEGYEIDARDFSEEKIDKAGTQNYQHFGVNKYSVLSIWTEELAGLIERGLADSKTQQFTE